VIVNLHAAAKTLGGKVYGKQIRCPGPGHSKNDESLSVMFDPSAPDGFVVESFSPRDDWRTCRDYVKHRLGIGHDYRGERRPRPEAKMAVEHATESHDKRNAALAAEVWAEGVPVMEHSVGRTYAKARNVDMSSTALRFHPACKTYVDGKLVSLPAIIAKMVPVYSIDTLVAIQRTFLRPDGSDKADLPGGGRRMLGPAKGACCKISRDEEVTTVLAVGEGIETMLSLRRIRECLGIPLWACMSAPALAEFPVLSGIEVLWVAVDNEDAGIKAAAQVKAQWVAAGCEVFQVKPNALHADLNDLVRNGRRNG
jgi:hypothetical protein